MKIYVFNRISYLDCKAMEFLEPGRKDFQGQIAIASLPGAGNTWLRHLFQISTGVWTGSVFREVDLFDGGFKGEFR